MATPISFPRNRHLHFTALLLHFAETETLDFIGFYRISDVVGYNTISDVANGQFIALAVQFEGITSAEVAIGDLVTAGVPAGANTLAANADQIWLWDTTTANWVKYFHRIQRGTDYGWCAEGATAATTDTVSAGKTVFFYRGGATTSLTLSGAVKASTGVSSATVSNGQFVFMSYPWPVAIAINGFSSYQTSPAGANTLAANADQIWFWDASKADWVKYFHRIQRGTDYGWCAEGETSATDATIPVGTGFFFYRGGSASATITFTATRGL